MEVEIGHDLFLLHHYNAESKENHKTVKEEFRVEIPIPKLS
jgi:hypothetical protein